MVKGIARYFLQLRGFSQNARFYLTSEVITGLAFALFYVLPFVMGRIALRKLNEPVGLSLMAIPAAIARVFINLAMSLPFFFCNAIFPARVEPRLRGPEKRRPLRIVGASGRRQRSQAAAETGLLSSQCLHARA